MNTLVNELSLIFARLGIDTYGVQIDVFDPWVDKDEAKLEYGLDLIDEPEAESYDAVVLRSLPVVEMTEPGRDDNRDVLLMRILRRGVWSGYLR